MSKKNSLETMYGRFYVYRYPSEYFKDYGGKSGVANYLNSHNSLLLLLAKKYKAHNIGELEDKYNKATEKEANFLKTLNAKNNQEHKDILSTMLQKFLKDLTPEQLNDILNNLVWDDNLQAFQYRGTSYSKGAKKDKDIDTSIGQINQYRIPSAVVKRLDKIIQQIKLSDKYSEEQKNSFKSSLQELRNKVIEYGKIREFKDQVGDNIEKITYKGKRAYKNSGEEKWQLDFSKWAYSEVRSRLGQLSDIDNLNKTLSWKFTELLGHFVAYKTSNAKSEIIKVIEDWAKHGIGHQKTTVARGGINWDKVEFLDQSFLASQSHYVKKTTGPNGEVYTLTPVVQNNTKLDGKTDAEFTVTYKDGKTEKVNLSIKNYDLTSDLAANNIGDLSITLQGKSRLLLYLEGAESIHRKFTIHMLNLLSDHEKEKVNDQSLNLQQLRGEAIRTLKNQLLYSALTGAAQMKAGLQANVFAVYDKGAVASGTPRIKLFDMGTIIEECLMNSDSIIAPNLDRYSASNPMFENTTENPEATSKTEIEAAAKLRITKIMHEARSKSVSVGLSKQLLNNIYSLR